MFMLRSTSNMKFIKKLLEKNGLHVEETTEPGYILTVRDPMPYIPESYRDKVSISQCDSYASILKKAGIIKKLTDAAEQYEFGTPVKITAGPYEGLTGRVIRAENKKECTVEISVWGKIIKEVVKSSDMEPFENPFN